MIVAYRFSQLNIIIIIISAICRKGRPKSEKNKEEKERFSWALSKQFFNKLYFSYRGNIS